MIADFETPSQPIIRSEQVQISATARTILTVIVMGIAAYKLYAILEMVKPRKGKK